MNWRIVHNNVAVTENSNIISKSVIVFSHNGSDIRIAETIGLENHALGSKKVLMDTAYKLEEMAREMKKKANQIN